MEKKLITIENGEKVEYEILIEFESNKTNKNYVAYLDKEDDEGNAKVKFASFTLNDGIYTLSEIEIEEEFEMFKTIIEEVQKETK